MKYKIPYPSIIPSYTLRKQIKKDLKIRIHRPKPRVWTAKGGEIVAIGGRTVNFSVTGRSVGPRMMVVGDHHPMDPVSVMHALNRMQVESRLHRFQMIDRGDYIIPLHDDCFIYEQERHKDPFRIGAKQLPLDIKDMYEEDGIQEIDLDNDFVVDLRVFSTHRQHELEKLFTEMCKKERTKKSHVRKSTFNSLDNYAEVSHHPKRDERYSIVNFTRHFGKARRSAKMPWSVGRTFSRVYERQSKLGGRTKRLVLKARGQKRKRAV